MRDENARRPAVTEVGAAEHYDLLVDEGNDPVHDARELRAYMDRWDGQEFIGKMDLCRDSSVLEIGVGTGRLAVRVAPLCGEFWGIDVSSKTIRKAQENLARQSNVTLICGDFLPFDFERSFDVVYSSLTFMHIRDKQSAVGKAAGLLNRGGKFVLSIDKNQDRYLDAGTRKVRIYPDRPGQMTACVEQAGLAVTELYETRFAWVFVCVKA